MIWFTSDQHFDHFNIIEYCQRPFGSLEEMNDEIIRRHNELVSPGDEVWHLGDFAWRNAATFLKALRGRRHHLCIGNHDHKHIRKDLGLFDSVHDVARVQFNGQTIWASHYAHARWPASHKGRCHLFGHSHGQFKGLGRSMDVGVDALDFRPISFEDAISKLLPIPFTHEAHKEG